MQVRRFVQYAWGVVIYNLAVILWGAYVRASGSGAGCGEHWPLCNGEVIPRAKVIETMVEFAHRLTSGLALISVIGLLIWAFRLYPRGHRVRRAAGFSLGFMISEALLGAGLVLFQLVALNESIARVFAMGAHLINTFLLIASMTLTAWWASGLPGVRLQRQGGFGVALLVALILTLVVGVTGAVIALGDTLFFAHVNSGGSEATISSFVQTLKELRIMHPTVAVLSSIYLGVISWQARRLRGGPLSTQLAITTTALIGLQVLAGVVNVYLKVPIYMQLIHLLLADLLWLNMVLVAASACAEPATEVAPATIKPQLSPA